DEVAQEMLVAHVDRAVGPGRAGRLEQRRDVLLEQHAQAVALVGADERGRELSSAPLARELEQAPRLESLGRRLAASEELVEIALGGREHLARTVPARQRLGHAAQPAR